MSNQSGRSKTDAIIKLFLIFCISLLSFSVGTFVGKQFSDSQHKLQAIHQGSGQDRETAAVDPDALHMKPDDALSDREISKLADEFSETAKEKNDSAKAGENADDKAAAKHDEHSNTKTEAHQVKPEIKGAGARHVANDEEPALEEHALPKKPTHNTADSEKPHAAFPAEVADHAAPAAVPEMQIALKHQDKAKAVKVAAERVAEGHDPVPAVAPVRKQPSELPVKAATDAVGKFTVQVSSHPREEDAATEAKKLKERGYSAFYVAGDAFGKIWYRVNIGLFANNKVADEYRQELFSRGGIKGYVQPVRQRVPSSEK